MSISNVDDRGIILRSPYAAPLDVLFGEHRVWSFTTEHDSVPTDGKLLVAWPTVLKARLLGSTLVTIRPHLDGDSSFATFSENVAFGGAIAPLRLVDDAGHPLSVDKGGRLQRTFDRMDSDSVRELVDASKRVLTDLVEECGLDAYLCYGGLLGAVRTGHMIGHDSDVDLAWLSRETHPYDIIRETRAAEARMRQLGWRVVRMSAANFKVWVPLPSGKRAGVDVFGSFHIADHFHITGSLRGTLDRAAIVPFGNIELEGIEFPAPRDLDAFLSFTYGPGWRVPDPAFHFNHPEQNKLMMSQWWRGSRPDLGEWQGFHNARGPKRDGDRSRAFTGFVNSRLAPQSTVIEVGAGDGKDGLWLAGQGHQVVITEMVGSANKRIANLAKESGLNARNETLNLGSLYGSLRRAARFARADKPVHVMARQVVDELDPWVRANLWRFCSITCRSGGRTYLEFRTGTGAAPRMRPKRGFPTDGAVLDEIQRFGGSVLAHEVHQRRADLTEHRVEVSWT